MRGDRTSSINFWASKKEKEEIKALARKRGLTIADLIRQLLKKEMDK